jgi:hypothetical protein
VGRSLWRENGFVVYNYCWPLPAQSFSGPTLVGLVTTFYYLRFDTSLFFASYDSQGYGGGIRSRLHTHLSRSRSLLPATSRQTHTWYRSYICSMSRPLSFFFLSLILLINKGRVGLLHIHIYSVHLLHLTPPEVTNSIFIAQQYLDCCLLIRCRGNMYTESLFSNEHLLWLPWVLSQYYCILP